MAIEKTSSPKRIEKFHVGIYAIIETGDSVLLVQKSRGPYKSAWDLPGGRPEHGEAILQTLQREVKEETGVKINSVTPYINESFLIEYKDGEETISLHHICLIYKVAHFDSSSFLDDIRTEDVLGSGWIKKRDLGTLSLSPAARCALKV